MRTQPTHHGLDRSASNDATARALVAAIPDPIFRIGVDGVYRGFKVDEEVDLLTPADEVIGRTVHQRLPPHIAEGVLSAGRRAVVMVTHDVDEAVLLSDRIVMMTNGPAATIGQIVDVDLPWPRDRLDLVEKPEFAKYRAAVVDFLHRKQLKKAA